MALTHNQLLTQLLETTDHMDVGSHGRDHALPHHTARDSGQPLSIGRPTVCPSPSNRLMGKRTE